jgi:hypothetical protein
MKQTKKFTSKIESDAIMLISDALHLVYTLGKRVTFFSTPGLQRSSLKSVRRGVEFQIPR